VLRILDIVPKATVLISLGMTISHRQASGFPLIRVLRPCVSAATLICSGWESHGKGSWVQALLRGRQASTL